ncbi:MAG TPA: hypothetical protein VMI11_10515 [Actinomycetes bacterium]|nr:hypothetical protein [Actinomycetes bacterium]
MALTPEEVDEAAAQARRRRLPRDLVIASAVLLAFASAILAMQLRGSDSRPIWLGHVVLASGSDGAGTWRLVGFMTAEGEFCLEGDFAGPASPGRYAAEGGACTFDDSPSGGYWYSSYGPGSSDSALSYGPLPTEAIAIQVTRTVTVASHPLPREPGWPRGRFWVFYDSGHDVLLDNLRPMSSSGQPVAFKDFP